MWPFLQLPRAPNTAAWPLYQCITCCLSFFLGDQNLVSVVPPYINVLEDMQLLPVRVGEDLNPSALSTAEELTSSSLENNNQTSETVHRGIKSSLDSPESSVVESTDTESPVLVNEYVCIV